MGPMLLEKKLIILEDNKKTLPVKLADHEIKSSTGMRLMQNFAEICQIYLEVIYRLRYYRFHLTVIDHIH